MSWRGDHLSPPRRKGISAPRTGLLPLTSPPTPRSLPGEGTPSAAAKRHLSPPNFHSPGFSLLLLVCVLQFLLLLHFSVRELGLESTHEGALDATHEGTLGSTNKAIHEAESEIGERSNVSSLASSLFQAWSETYGLDAATAPAAIKPCNKEPLSDLFPESIPSAPHLEECSLLTELRRDSEAVKAGHYPEWACANRGAVGSQGSGAFCNNPKPPWIRGADSDNLPLTRVTQRDLWVHQFPLDCTAPAVRFLLVPWPDPGGHGMGSQLHVMSVALSIALQSNRVLVPWPGSFSRANHQGCPGWGAVNSSACYFFPLTSQECVDEAMLHAPPHYPEMWTKVSEEANSSERLVALPFSACLLPMEASAAERWGEPWKQMTAPFYGLHGTPRSYEQQRLKVTWWRSQAVRFFVRWPSSYLCHLTNRARHAAYGQQVSLQVVQAREAQLAYQNRLKGNMSASEAEILSRFRIEHPSSNLFQEPQFWGSKPGISRTPDSLTDASLAIRSSTGPESSPNSIVPKSSNPNPSLLNSSPQDSILPDSKPPPLQHPCSPPETLPSNNNALSCEPYMPRPTVSLHVRGGDKSDEMRVFSLASSMWLAQHVRAQVPNLRHIWLSSESQSIFEETAQYPDWQFLHTEEQRQQKANEKSFDYESAIGMEAATGAAYVNAIMIGPQCDYFIGTLASNWDRVINELRLTSGRLRTLYLTLNNDEW